MRVQLQGYIPSVQLLANTPVAVIYVHDQLLQIKYEKNMMISFMF